MKKSLFFLVAIFIVMLSLCGCDEMSSEKAITDFAIMNPYAAGIINEELKTITVTMPYGTPVTELIATFKTTGKKVMVGRKVQVSGKTVNDFTETVSYHVFAENGSHTAYAVTVIVSSDPPSSEKSISAFSIAETQSMGVIDETLKFISVIVPDGTDRTALTAIFETTGASVKVGGIEQESGSTLNDFTDKVLYAVIAEDGSMESYTVLVTLQNSVYLQSDSGDYIGLGNTYIYTRMDAQISASLSENLFSVNVDGDENWNGNFKAPNTVNPLEAGTYDNLTRYPFHDPAVGGLDWSGEGRGCNTLTGWFAVDHITYTNGNLSEIDLSFEQHCEDSDPALHGKIHWTIYDNALPPGPMNPPPADLWEADPDAIPEDGNYVYLESDSGDYIGLGQTYTYTPDDSQITSIANGGLFTVTIAGDEDWTGNFKAMDNLTDLEPGYYGDLERYPFYNPVRGGLSWSGEGRGCNTLTGWFVIDRIVYEDGALTEIDLRFEQHCEGGDPALHGQIHWTSDDTTGPPGPVFPVPEDLWAADPDATPESGNYVYLQSDSGDYIGAGQTYTYTLGDSLITPSVNSNLFSIRIDGDEDWNGNFKAMDSLTDLEPGYYGNLERYPFHNPARGGLSWSGEGRGCNTLTGWFAVDHIVYTDGDLSEIDLRFEQHCEGVTPALHGQIHWNANDPTEPPGPVFPPPEDLWEPEDGTTPETGNYVYLESDPGDYIGIGQTYTYSQADSEITPSSGDGLFGIRIEGNETWYGNFKAMDVLPQLEEGYYGDLERYPFYNPARGGLSWTGNGRGCNTLTGWFVVDHIAYEGEELSEIDLRFEQHCEGNDPALHGQVHWVQ